MHPGTTISVPSELLETLTPHPVKQLSVFLQNRVGALMSLVRLLKDRKIEVLGLSLQESTELTLVRFVLSDPEGAETLFMERGIPHVVSTLVVVELREGDHDLAHVLSTLLAAEVNIHVSYGILTRPSHYPLLALHVDDDDIARDVLNHSGFKVMTQGDLSR
jgi:hypothetical protein